MMFQQDRHCPTARRPACKGKNKAMDVVETSRFINSFSFSESWSALNDIYTISFLLHVDCINSKSISDFDWLLIISSLMSMLKETVITAPIIYITLYFIFSVTTFHMHQETTTMKTDAPTTSVVTTSKPGIFCSFTLSNKLIKSGQ